MRLHLGDTPFSSVHGDRKQAIQIDNTSSVKAIGNGMYCIWPKKIGNDERNIQEDDNSKEPEEFGVYYQLAVFREVQFTRAKWFICSSSRIAFSYKTSSRHGRHSARTKSSTEAATRLRPSATESRKRFKRSYHPRIHRLNSNEIVRYRMSKNIPLQATTARYGLER